MISLRYHIVSIAAVFLALAVGVALGSTSVSERLLSSVGGDLDTLRLQARDLRAERNAQPPHVVVQDPTAGEEALLTAPPYPTSRPAGQDGFSGFNVSPAPPAAELSRSAKSQGATV